LKPELIWFEIVLSGGGTPMNKLFAACFTDSWASAVVSRTHGSQVKVKVKVEQAAMDRYKRRGDDDGESGSFSWPTKAANPAW